MNDRITQLQLAVLGILIDGDAFGREVRGRLAELKMKKSRPAFYQLMQRLEDAGYVKGWYEEQVTTKGRRVQERKYKILAPGKRAMADAAFVLREVNFGF